MSGFPTSIDSFPTILPSDKQDTAGKELDAVLNSFSSAIVAAETRIGINGSADINNQSGARMTAARKRKPQQSSKRTAGNAPVSRVALDSVNDW